MTDDTTSPAEEKIEAVAESPTEEEIPVEMATIDVLKTKGANKGVRKARVIVIHSFNSEAHGTVRLVCSPNRNVWYLAVERPVEGNEVPTPIRHEREATKQFMALCEPE